MRSNAWITSQFNPLSLVLANPSPVPAHSVCPALTPASNTSSASTRRLPSKLTISGNKAQVWPKSSDLNNPRSEAAYTTESSKAKLCTVSPFSAVCQVNPWSSLNDTPRNSVVSPDSTVVSRVAAQMISRSRNCWRAMATTKFPEMGSV